MSNYPEGANTTRAPWNEPDPWPLIDADMALPKDELFEKYPQLKEFVTDWLFDNREDLYYAKD